jgi:hypothetical protein
MPDRRGILKLAFDVSLLAVAAWACARSPERPKTMLMDRMQQLAQAPALTFELIQKTLEVAFAKDARASHDMVTFFIGTPRPGSRFESLIKLVDCRVPTPQNTALTEPFVVVELQDAGEERTTRSGRRPAPLLTGDVVAKLGQPDSFQPSLPEDPESSGSYIYKTRSRSLWLSLGRQVADEVRWISIHPLEDVRRP